MATTRFCPACDTFDRKAFATCAVCRDRIFAFCLECMGDDYDYCGRCGRTVCDECLVEMCVRCGCVCRDCIHAHSRKRKCAFANLESEEERRLRLTIV